MYMYKMHSRIHSLLHYVTLYILHIIAKTRTLTWNLWTLASIGMGPKYTCTYVHVPVLETAPWFGLGESSMHMLGHKRRQYVRNVTQAQHRIAN